MPVRSGSVAPTLIGENKHYALVVWIPLHTEKSILPLIGEIKHYVLDVGIPVRSGSAAPTSHRRD